MKKNSETHIWIISILAGVLAAAICAVLVGYCCFSNLAMASQVGIEAVSDIKDIRNENEALRKAQQEIMIQLDQDRKEESPAVYVTNVTEIVDNIMPSVVSITSRTLVNSGGYADFFSFSFGSSSGPSEIESGIGSGTIVKMDDENCYILTSYHVVEDSSSFYITFNDGSAVDGVMKASDPDCDIAVVSVPVKDIEKETLDAIKPATLSSAPVPVGEGIVIIGNSLGFGQSVVCGVISAIDREIDHNKGSISVIQTDAAINSGNSGGCMLNTKGEIIGISEAKISNSSVEGMCYAISVEHYYDTIMELLG